MHFVAASLPLTIDGLLQAAGAQVHVVPSAYVGGAGLSAFGSF
jgi:hypothetical protein